MEEEEVSTGEHSKYLSSNYPLTDSSTNNSNISWCWGQEGEGYFLNLAGGWVSGWDNSS